MRNWWSRPVRFAKITWWSHAQKPVLEHYGEWRRRDRLAGGGGGRDIRKCQGGVRRTPWDMRKLRREQSDLISGRCSQTVPRFRPALPVLLPLRFRQRASLYCRKYIIICRAKAWMFRPVVQHAGAGRHERQS